MSVEMRIGHYCAVCLEPLVVDAASDGIRVNDDDLSINVRPHRCDVETLRECAERDGVADADELFERYKREALL